MLKKKLIPIVSAVLLVGAGVFPSITNASVVTKNLQASYHDVKVKYNNYTVSTDIEPFIVNGTTYIPLRMMAGVFNKDISWDGSTYTINVTDREDPRIAALEAEIAAKDAKIKDLQEQLQDAEDEANEKDVDEQIDDLEDNLNDDYGDYKDLEWSVSLSGDEDDIDVEISIDLQDYEDEYGELDTSDIEDLVQDITNDIWDEFEDADISGVIIDSDSDDELHDFNGYSDDETIELDGDEI